MVPLSVAVFDRGVFFTSAANPANSVRVTRILKNDPTSIIGHCPNVDFAVGYIEVVTMYSTGGTLLKSPRTIRSPFTIEKG